MKYLLLFCLCLCSLASALDEVVELVSKTRLDGTVEIALEKTTRDVTVKLTASATLNFPEIAAGRSATLTITVTGAEKPWPVILGVPNGATDDNIIYTAWVSSLNTVKIKANNLNTLTAINPTQAKFIVIVMKIPAEKE